VNVDVHLHALATALAAPYGAGSGCTGGVGFSPDDDGSPGGVGYLGVPGLTGGTLPSNKGEPGIGLGMPPASALASPIV
jgi:hypothetical protein